jgi:hypothetical protein
MQNRSLHNTKLFHMGRLYSINMMMYVEEKSEEESEKRPAVGLRLRLAELFLAEEGEVADTDDDLEDHTDPESWVAETLANVVGH